MKKKGKILIIVLFLTIGFAIFSCKKSKPDKTAPVFVLSDPVSGQTYHAGSNINFNAEFTDDIALGQYKIEVHDAFDGHSHKMAAKPWSSIIVEVISGASLTVNKSIAIPSDAAAGSYDFIIYCLDKAGNEAAFQELKITIVNPSDIIAPTINTSSPSPGSHYTSGAVINIVGTVTDDQILKDVELKIMKEGSSTLVFDENYPVTGSSHSINVFVPTTGWPAGNYVLKIKARDITYNLSDKDINLLIN